MTSTLPEVGHAPVLLRIEHLSKYFGGVVALDDVGIDIRAGEVHGLVGQNGSGKSTLIKCLSGFHAPDSRWTLTVGDRVLHRALHPGETAGLGISFVQQDLGMLPDLTVLENLMLGQIAGDHRPYIPWRKERKQAAALFDAFGLDLDPRAKLSAFRPVEQAQVAIIRAVLQLRDPRRRGAGTGVLVLDEATTFLDRDGRQSLYQLLRSIVSAGAGSLFVSHDVGEVLGLADRITVLRDGRLVETVPSADVTHDDIVGLIIAARRSVHQGPAAAGPAGQAAATPATGTAGGPTAAPPIGRLDVTGLTGDLVRDVELHARGGDIVGVTGIVGSGWEFVLEHIYGARPSASGVLAIDGDAIDLSGMTPARAVDLGMVFVPSDRLRQGIVGELSVKENVTLPVLGQMFDRGVLQLRRLTSRCARLLADHAVTPPNPSLAIGLLSGGNQQKAVLGKWLQLAPRVLLLNEPTQGVDVGARQVILATIRAQAARGALVLYASGDWEEVQQISNRVLVVADGRVCAELAGDDLSLDRIAQAAYQGTRRSADLASASQAWEKVGQ
ncbi:MAG: sugar ABC transporter ATP-binding protein [Streptosporangiaceae bacterium]